MQKEKKYQGSWSLMFLIIVVTSAILSFVVDSPKQQEKKYSIQVSLNEANALLYCLDKSNAEHLTVATLSKLITDQVNAQIKTDDSLLKLKEKPKTDTSKKKN